MHAYFANSGRQALSHKLPIPTPGARLAQLTLDQPRRDLTLTWCAQSACKQSSRLMPALDQHTGDKFQICAVCGTWLVSAKLHLAHITTCCRSFPCSKCKRTFTSSRGVPDLTLTSGIDPGVYKSESFAGQDIFRCPALLPCASACWHLAGLLRHCLFLLDNCACLQLIAVLHEFAGIPLSASFMSVAGGKGSSQLDFQVSTVRCKHESVNYFPSRQ